jgi:DNA-binding NarL/FixJ family response regulator
MVSLIRTVVVDDHPAMRAGVEAVLASAPDIEPTGAAASGAELWPVIERTAPDLVLMDWHLPGDDGLVLCHRVKRRYPSIRVVLFSAYADEWLVLPALLAQADALLAKRAPARTVHETLRSVMAGEQPEVTLTAEQREALSSQLPLEDVGIAGLLLLRTPLREIAARTGLSSAELGERVEQILTRMSAAYGPGVTFDRESA